MISALPIGGVHNRIKIMHIGPKPPIIYGFLRPHFDEVLSEIIPRRGSFKAFQILHIMNPIVIKRTDKPTTAK
jgi:hypothetical protein